MLTPDEEVVRQKICKDKSSVAKPAKSACCTYSIALIELHRLRRITNESKEIDELLEKMDVLGRQLTLEESNFVSILSTELNALHGPVALPKIQDMDESEAEQCLDNLAIRLGYKSAADIDSLVYYLRQATNDRARPTYSWAFTNQLTEQETMALVKRILNYPDFKVNEVGEPYTLWFFVVNSLIDYMGLLMRADTRRT